MKLLVLSLLPILCYSQDTLIHYVQRDYKIPPAGVMWQIGKEENRPRFKAGRLTRVCPMCGCACHGCPNCANGMFDDIRPWIYKHKDSIKCDSVGSTIFGAGTTASWFTLEPAKPKRKPQIDWRSTSLEVTVCNTHWTKVHQKMYDNLLKALRSDDIITWDDACRYLKRYVQSGKLKFPCSHSPTKVSIIMKGVKTYSVNAPFNGIPWLIHVPSPNDK